MTPGGGDSDYGVIFSIGTDGSAFTLLHEFAGGPDDGLLPRGSLTLSGSTLYGMTWRGGDSNNGVIFSMEATVNDRIEASSGSGSCPGCAPAPPPGYPRFTMGDPDLYEDYMTIESGSASGIPMPLRAVLSTLEPESVYGFNTDGGGDRPPTAYWTYSITSHDGTTSADNVLDPGERITRLWQFADEGGAAFDFWANIYRAGSKGGERLGRFSFSSASGATGTAEGEDSEAIRIDDGTAEIFAGAATSAFVLANRFSTSSPVSLRAVSFYTSGWAAGDEADLILYEDPSGAAPGPAPAMEVWRTTVVLGGGGFQEVSAAGCPTINAASAPGATFYAAVANRVERSYTLGVDMTGPKAGASYVFTDSGATFAPLASIPIIDGNAMIRVYVKEAGACFIGAADDQ